MKNFKSIRNELFEESCPVATVKLEVNAANRQRAIDDFNYGPANPQVPGDYWKKAAKIWGIDEKTAMTMKCENCAAFDISDKMRKCIEVGMKGDEKAADAMATAEKADLGYCNILHFKCAGTRSCSVWLTNGPIDNEDRTE